MREAELKSQKTKSVFIQILTEIKQWTGNPDKQILVPAHSLTRQTDCSVFSSVRQDVVTLGPSPVLKFCTDWVTILYYVRMSPVPQNGTLKSVWTYNIQLVHKEGCFQVCVLKVYIRVYTKNDL